METRSSPSLHVLQGLARQAHIDAQDVSTLSKPALFVHLRSNYDYPRLERAHQKALKRGDGGDADCGCSGGMGMGMGVSNKRPCRAGAGGSSSAASFDEEQGLPPASIFVQTRSRTRMQLASAGVRAGGSAEGGSADQSRPGRVPGCSNSTSPSRRSQNRKTSGGGRRAAGAGGGGSASRGKGSSGDVSSSGSGSGGDSGSGSGSSSGGAISSNSSSSSGSSSSRSSGSSSSGGLSGVGGERGGGGGDGGGGGSGSVIDDASATGEAEELHTTDNSPEDAAACDTSGGAESRKPDVGAETNRTTENIARRKGRRGRRATAASGRSSRKGKGKGKAKEHSGGVPEGKGRGCEVREDIASGGAVAAGSSSNSSGVEKEDRAPPNELDPIMLIKVGKDHHRFVRPNGRVVMYNLDSLVDYFISTGDFLEPETRLPFSDEELRTIDMKAKAAGLSKPSVLEAKRDPRRYAEQKFQQDALVGLERMTSELVTGMLRVVEGCDREEGEIRLVTELFPPFADLFKQIWGADKDFASQCMQHYTSWLQGPPNRPTEDEMGFLDIILGFLRQLQECDGSSSLGF